MGGDLCVARTRYFRELSRMANTRLTHSQCGENEIFVPLLCEKKNVFLDFHNDFSANIFEIVESECDIRISMEI